MSDTSRPIKTSVIIPVYNTEDYLRETLESVLRQTQREIEVILVDDGSTDKSLEIEREFEQRDSRIRVIEQQNLRQGTARNRGLFAARGEYVYFMDSDDLIEPDLFETCYQACEEDDLDFATFDTAGFLGSPSNLRPDLFPEVADRRGVVSEEVCDGVTFWRRYFREGQLPVICWLEYFRRDFLLENDLFFTEQIYFEDNDWIVRVYLAAKRMRYLPHLLHRYRERPGSNVHSGFKQVLAESCFDVHSIVCELAERETNPDRIIMLRDLNNVVNARFRQFGELAPDEEFIQQTSWFASELFELCRESRYGEDVRRLHLETLLNLVMGTSAWVDDPIPLDGSDIVTLLFPGLTRDFATGHIGMYGTGRVCKLLLSLVDFHSADLVFLDTDPKGRTSMEGHPLLAIADASDEPFDTVLITSTRYADALAENVHLHLGPEVAVYTITSDIFALEWMLAPQANCITTPLPLVNG